MQWIQ
jgi:hypothetical protein